MIIRHSDADASITIMQTGPQSFNLQHRDKVISRHRSPDKALGAMLDYDRPYRAQAAQEYAQAQRAAGKVLVIEQQGRTIFETYCTPGKPIPVMPGAYCPCP